MVAWLERQSAQIVARNLRLGYLELDIVARWGEVIAVVEVRTRGRRAWTHGLGSIDGKKRYRVRLAGERLWQRRYRDDPTVTRLRYDAASVTLHADGSGDVEYVKAAF